MPTSFTPRFVDLVRCTCSTVGTGNLALGAAVSGFASFAVSLSVGDRFYYAVAGIDKPAETEVGRGTIAADGSIVREAISGTLTNFTTGVKTVSLVAGAEWFRKANAGAIDTTTLATRDQSNLGAAVNELAKLTPLFSELATTRIPVAVRRIFTAGRTAVGLAPGAYVRDPDQGMLTSIGQEYVTALPVAEQAAGAAAVAAILNRVRARDADGQYWVIDDDGCQVHAGHFGAIADGYYNEATGVMTGTDNAPAIQAMIDWRVYLRRYTAGAARDCRLPAGMLRIGQMIELSYADTFSKVVLRGAGIAFPIGLGGTTLMCDFDDRPGIAIEGGRYSGVEDLSLLSAGRAWTMNKQLGTYVNGARGVFGIDDRDITRWHDPARPARNALLRYNPNCAVAVDPYCGPQPTAVGVWAANAAVPKGQYVTVAGNLLTCRIAGTSGTSAPISSDQRDMIADGSVMWGYCGPAGQAIAYPVQTPPAFLPTAARIGYGRTHPSSAPILRNVGIIGFSVGVACQPSDWDANGDFLRTEDCFALHTTVPVTIGNTQARNLSMERFDAANFHTLLAGMMHGRQNGRVEGRWTLCSTAEGIQLFELQNQAARGSLVFDTMYGEALYRIGTLGTSGASGCIIQFNGGNLSFDGQSAVAGGRGVAHYLIGGVATGPFGGSGAPPTAPILLDGCDLGNFVNVASIQNLGLDVRNCGFTAQDGYDVDGTMSAARARAINTLAGGLVTPAFTLPATGGAIRYPARNETVLGEYRASSTAPRNRQTSRDYPASIYTASLSPTAGDGAETIDNPRAIWASGKAGLNCVLSGLGLTFSVVTNAAALVLTGIRPGAVIYDTDSGHVFMIEAVTGSSPYAVTARLQNGYRTRADGSIELDSPYRAASGSMFVAIGGVFTPSSPLFADLSAGSATLTRVDRGDGWSGFLSAGVPVAVGDLLYADQYRDADHLPMGVKVAAIAPGNFPGASITLSGQAVATVVRRRLPLWMRAS